MSRYSRVPRYNPPKTLSNLAFQQLCEKLVAPIEAKIVESINDTIDANHRLGGNEEGFLFRGEWVTNRSMAIAIQIEDKKPLHHSLQDGYLFILETKRQLWQEEQALRQGIGTVLTGCETWQDIRDALSNSLAMQIEETRSLPRTRPEAWTLQGKPLHMPQYEQARDAANVIIGKLLIL